MSEKNEITIGCDPEYGLIKAGRLIIPNEIIRNSTTEFGIDGSGRVAELRPNYSKTPGGLVENIQKTLQEGVKTFPALLDLRMKAGSVAVEEPIGGHVHFGHAQLKKPEKARVVAEALDKTAAVLTLMVEDAEEALNRRVGSSYGQTGSSNYRDQPWGMEYRVLSSWLTSPEEARAILSLCYIVASEWHDDEVMSEACSLPAFDSTAFRECDKIGLMYWIPPIVEFVKKLPKYDKYAEDIRPLFKLIRNQKIWACDKNMIDTWNLKPAPAKTKRHEVEYV